MASLSSSAWRTLTALPVASSPARLAFAPCNSMARRPAFWNTVPRTRSVPPCSTIPLPAVPAAMDETTPPCTSTSEPTAVSAICDWPRTWTLVSRSEVRATAMPTVDPSMASSRSSRTFPSLAITGSPASIGAVSRVWFAPAPDRTTGLGTTNGPWYVPGSRRKSAPEGAREGTTRGSVRIGALRETGADEDYGRSDAGGRDRAARTTLARRPGEQEGECQLGMKTSPPFHRSSMGCTGGYGKGESERLLEAQNGCRYRKLPTRAPVEGAAAGRAGRYATRPFRAGGTTLRRAPKKARQPARRGPPPARNVGPPRRRSRPA